MIRSHNELDFASLAKQIWGRQNAEGEESIEVYRFRTLREFRREWPQMRAKETHTEQGLHYWLTASMELLCDLFLIPERVGIAKAFHLGFEECLHFG